MALFPHFHRTYPPEHATPDQYTVWILLQDADILVRTDGDRMTLPRGEAPLMATVSRGAPVLLGRIGEISYVTTSIAAEHVVEDSWQACDLRSLYGRIPDVEWSLAGYASQIAHWERTSGFCPVCGHEMGAMGPEWKRCCTHCRHERYPSVSPAVLALVHDGDRILLAHKPGWGARRSILAGFAVPGESLEECVHREVLEEAGVRVSELQYFGSQPWPFPHQIMIGFYSRYVSGDIVIDAEELAGAEWYDFENLPQLPPPLSLSRQMIDAWTECRRTSGQTSNAERTPS